MFNGLAVLSLLLCVATLQLWIQSESANEVFWFHSRWTDKDRVPMFFLWHEVGVATVGIWSVPWDKYEDEYAREGSYWRVPTFNPARDLRDVSFGFNGGCLTFPYWMLAMTLSVLPVMVFGPPLLRRLKPPRPGHCLQCSYNLTGNVSGVCPECGKPISSTA
jgi:hypothetical protein